MKAFAILALATVSQAAVIAPYSGLAGLPLGLAGGYAAGYAGLAAPYGLGLGYAGAPLAAAAPLAYAAAPINPTPSSQFQAQDEFRNFQYGYANINSAKKEAGNALTGVTGSYSYVDANGIVQTTNYIADGLGFRVQATNLPVAPIADLQMPVAPIADLKMPVFDLVGPAPVDDTPEVKAAKAEFMAAFEEAKNRAKRSTPAATLPLGYGYGLGLGLPTLGYGLGGYAAPLGAAPLTTYAAGLAAPLNYGAPAAVVASAPASREAVLTKIQLTPGHAIAYNVM